MRLRSVLFFLVVFCLISCTSKREKSKANFAKAVSEFYSNHYQSSKDLFTSCIEADYNKSESYFYRGSSRFNLKDYDGAVEDLTQAIRVDSLYADAYCTRGDIYAILGKKDLGCKDWQKAKALGKPNMGDKVKYCQ